MQFNISDSDSEVNRIQPYRFRINDINPATLSPVANRQDALSDYIRMRIRDWGASGREYKELARIAGIAMSSPSTVLMGTGVGRKTGRGYAVAFGFGPRSNPDAAYKALQDAAYKWWLSKGQQAADAVANPDDPGISEAIDVLTKTMGASEAQIRTIMADFTAPRFAGRESMFWIQTIGEELKRDRTSAIVQAADAKEDGKYRAKVRASRREKASALATNEKELTGEHRRQGKRAS